MKLRKNARISRKKFKGIFRRTKGIFRRTSQYQAVSRICYKFKVNFWILCETTLLILNFFTQKLPKIFNFTEKLAHCQNCKNLKGSIFSNRRKQRLQIIIYKLINYRYCIFPLFFWYCNTNTCNNKRTYVFFKR